MLRWSSIDSADLDMMGFGQEFQEIKAADLHLSESVHFLNEVKEFVRERAELERDFARRLEALAKKYASRKSKTEKRSSGFFGGGAVPVSPGGSLSAGSLMVPGEDGKEDDRASTVQQAWSSIIHETENDAKAHLTLSDSLLHDICEKLKTFANKKDEARKKHITFSHRLLAERDKIYEEKDKAKYKYDMSCDAVEAAKQKHNRAPDDKSAAKLKRSWHQEIVDLNNNKNMYIITLAMANARKMNHYTEDLPGVLKNMQDLSETISQGLKQILQDYVSRTSTSLESLLQNLETTRTTVESIDAKRDRQASESSRGGVEKIVSSEPPDFEFVASGLWKDSGDMAKDEYSRVFLHNKLAKIRKRLENVEEEITVKQKGLEGTRTLLDAYLKDRSTGDPDDVKEGMLETMRDLVVLEGLKMKYETKIRCVVDAIGGECHSFADCDMM
ncbi:hypothetical protein HK097_002069 [Rhizophlyctis rosea]|uniref:F-BAR domain-containing protein n=1 Tax=Rhizophlyctis rosea TaxID=64517 RepID=A0AAD5S6H5_9FUNG|nr:hypothetical protein HK097_002069 [Rhizophlyctis rosea]